MLVKFDQLYCSITIKKPLVYMTNGAVLAGAEGFEPSQCQSQSLMPYRLAMPQGNKLILS